MNIIETNFKWNGSLSRRTSTVQTILHHAAAINCSVEDVHRWHLGNGWAGIGYHYFVRKDGTVFRGRPEWAVGAHAIGANGNSIGICAEGNFDIEEMSTEQKNAILELVQDIKNRYGNLAVKGHKEVSSTNCPGNDFPLAELKSGETAQNNEIERINEDMKIWKNGSTKESVYQYSNMSKEIGSLAPYEQCQAVKINDTCFLVYYKVDGTNYEKCGFVSYNGGI